MLADCRLYLLFTPELCTGDPWQTLAAAIGSGVDIVQWRRKESDDAGFRRCRDVCSERGVPVIVNDDVMLAVRGHARGAHVGQTDTPAEAARRLLGDGWLGVSTHDLPQLERAQAAGADYVGFGPCFPTATKGYAEGLPPELVEAAAAAARVPLFAIGGITIDNLAQLRGRGVGRIAVASAILRADDPAAAAADLRERLG